jgi:hypothetical protein
MLIPLLVSSVFVGGLMLVCFTRPEAGRRVLGVFYLIMALGVNGSFTFGNPQAYVDYAEQAVVPLYRAVAVAVIGIQPTIFGLLLMAFEISMALLILHRGWAVRMGLLGTILFLVGMAPLGWLQVPWLGLAIAEAYLLRRDFETSVLERMARGLTGSMRNVFGTP